MSLISAVAIIVGRTALAADDPAVLRPVPIVANGRLQVTTERGTGKVSLDVSRDWTVPEPGITRAIVMIPGWSRRDLTDGALAADRAGIAARDAIVITPQFLIQADVEAHQLPDDVLRWGVDDWKAGYAARSPARISSFDAVDAILGRLANRQLFANLRNVVIAGHSAGGQFVQRYAVVGREPDALVHLGVHVRYVVSNPSSYVYFSADRPPTASGDPAVTADRCERVNEWEYGFDGRLPGYVSQPVDAEALESEYISRDVVYLLGTADTDPNHPELDRTCAGEAQGPNRFARGINFVSYVAARHAGAFHQRLLEVPGVGHHGDQMFSSVCGVAALFDTAGCTDTPLDALHLATPPH